MRKKILHIISSKTWRGGEQQVQYLLHHPSEKYEKYLFCPEDAVLVKANIIISEKIFTYKKRFGLNLTAALQLKKISKENNFDLLHLHDSHAINAYLLARFFGLNIPCVIQRHLNFPIKTKWKYNHPSIEKIICVSDEVKITMQKVIDVNRLVVVYTGIDVKRFSKKDPSYSLKKELQIPEENKIVGMVSALEPEKNIDEFFLIAEQFITKNPSTHFVLVGDGSMKAIFNHRHSANIHLLGFRNNIAEILPEFDIFLFTTKHEEGFPLVLLEAMAASVPIITTNSGGIKSMVTDNQNGIIYRSGNTADAISKLELLLADENLYNTLLKNAFEYVQQFDVTLMNQKIEEVYSSINI